MTDFTRNLSVKWRLAGFIAFLILLLLGSGLAGLNGTKNSNKALSAVYFSEVQPLKILGEADNLFQISLVGSVDKILFEQISWEQGLENIVNAREQLKGKWAKMYSLSKAGEGDMSGSWFSPAVSLLASSEETCTELIGLIKLKDAKALDIFTDEKLYPLANKYKYITNQLAADRLNAAKNEYDSAQKRYGIYQTSFAIMMVIALIISIVASYLLIKGIDKPLTTMTEAMQKVIKGDLTQRLEFGRHDEFGLLIKGFNQMSNYLADLVSQIQRSGIQVTSSITELAATNKEQEVTANQHAATSSEIAASTSQIAATGTNLLQTMKKVNSLTKNAAFAAEEGHSGLENIDKTMVRMEEATGSIVTKLQILNEKAGNIAGVVQTINKVADQTNLLSLNAAIEAEKAGEYGAGFAVVATEIRRLADQTAVATFDIEQMVREVQTAISAAVMGIDKFAEDAHHSVEEVGTISEQLAGVIEQVEILTPQVESLTEGIEAQTLGAKQISEAVHQLNEAAQQTAESLTQTSASISQLHKAAMLLQEGAAIFKVDSDSGRKNASSSF